MFARLSADRKLLFFSWKTTAMTISPMTTGSEPSSPPRTRRLKSLR